MLSIFIIFQLNLTENRKPLLDHAQYDLTITGLDVSQLAFEIKNVLIFLLILKKFQLNISSKTQHSTCVLMLPFNLSLQTNKSKKNSTYTHCVEY